MIGMTSTPVASIPLTWLVLLPVGGMVVLFWIFSGGHAGRVRGPRGIVGAVFAMGLAAIIVSAVFAIGLAAIVALFAGVPAPRSGRVQPTTVAPPVVGSTAHATGSIKPSTPGDNDGTIATPAVASDNASPNDTVRDPVESGRSGTVALSIGSGTDRLGRRAHRVDSRLRELGQRVRRGAVRKIGPSATRRAVFGGTILSLMFLGYVVLSAVRTERFDGPICVLLAMAVVSLVASLAATHYML